LSGLIAVLASAMFYFERYLYHAHPARHLVEANPIDHEDSDGSRVDLAGAEVTADEYELLPANWE
jgi:hypothetical protein